MSPLVVGTSDLTCRYDHCVVCCLIVSCGLRAAYLFSLLTDPFITFLPLHYHPPPYNKCTRVYTLLHPHSLIQHWRHSFAFGSAHPTSSYGSFHLNLSLILVDGPGWRIKYVMGFHCIKARNGTLPFTCHISNQTLWPTQIGRTDLIFASSVLIIVEAAQNLGSQHSPNRAVGVLSSFFIRYLVGCLRGYEAM